jgi:hypothetical protein
MDQCVLEDPGYGKKNPHGSRRIEAGFDRLSKTGAFGTFFDHLA